MGWCVDRCALSRAALNRDVHRLRNRQYLRIKAFYGNTEKRRKDANMTR